MQYICFGGYHWKMKDNDACLLELRERPRCLQCGREMAKHEYRARRFKINEDRTCTAFIPRFKCPDCNIGEQMLPTYLLPFRHYTVPVAEEILEDFSSRRFDTKLRYDYGEDLFLMWMLAGRAPLALKPAAALRRMVEVLRAEYGGKGWLRSFIEDNYRQFARLPRSGYEHNKRDSS